MERSAFREAFILIESAANVGGRETEGAAPVALPADEG
jgi:hypothetical protein